MSRPVPNPGILEIAPYTPGKSPVPEPGRKVFKLSANETPLGASPRAIEACKSAMIICAMPDGASAALPAIGRAPFPGWIPTASFAGRAPTKFSI